MKTERAFLKYLGIENGGSWNMQIFPLENPSLSILETGNGKEDDVMPII